MNMSAPPSSTATSSENTPSPLTTDHSLIRYEDIGARTYVGQGAFGIVERGLWGKWTVAVKFLHNPTGLKREINNLKRVFGGEHIVGVYGLTTDDHGRIGIVMEYCANGTLRCYLESNFQKFTWDTKLNMAQEIAKGLLFIHHKGLLHRDLHDDNVLIDGGRHALIADFGLAKPIVSTDTSGNRNGRAAFIPPERLMEEQGRFTEQGDIYSLGGILWELTAGRQPFHGKTNIAVGVAVLGGIRENPIDGTPKWYQGIYTMCWATDPTNRPNTDLVVQSLTQRGQYRISF
jgi:serine/threonine protein kinase